MALFGTAVIFHSKVGELSHPIELDYTELGSSPRFAVWLDFKACLLTTFLSREDTKLN